MPGTLALLDYSVMLRKRPKSSAGKYRLYCNLGYNLSEEIVRRYFQQLCTQGQILDVYIPRHNSGRNKGYGFATFETEADLLNALQRPEHVIEGNIVKINRAGPRPEYDQSHLQQDLQQQGQRSIHGRGPRLYVGGITDDLIEDDIRNHFGRWGNVVDIYFPGKSGLKRVNYCFVTFDTWQAAQQACNQSERSINGQAIQSISLAEERTSEARDASSLGLLGSDPLNSPGLPELDDWTHRFSSLSLQNLQGVAGQPQALVPSSGLSKQQEHYAGPAIHTATNSDEEIREQLLQSMLHRDNFDSAQAQQSPYWLQSYQGAISQPGQSMPGYGGANPYGFLRAGSERGSKTADSLQSLQQAVSARDLGLRLSGQQGSGSMPYPEALQAQPEGQRTDWAFQGQRSTLPGSAKSSLPSPYAPLQSSPPSGYQLQEHLLEGLRDPLQSQQSLGRSLASDTQEPMLHRR